MQHHRFTAQQGLTLVELMVGLALGLLVVAAALGLLASQWREQRSLGIEGRLMQDLRTASDIVTHDLRRAGHWGAATAGLPQSGASAPLSNPYAAMAPASAASDAIAFRYSRDERENGAVDAREEFGLRLRNGVVELLLGAGNWQALTDAGTMTVTDLQIVPTVSELGLSDHCADCGTACAPRQQIRSVAVTLVARAAADPRVSRSLTSEVRVRNDVVVGACPA
jgi:type IV pilus assembly protein PilW